MVRRAEFDNLKAQFTRTAELNSKLHEEIRQLVPLANNQIEKGNLTKGANATESTRPIVIVAHCAIVSYILPSPATWESVPDINIARVGEHVEAA